MSTCTSYVHMYIYIADMRKKEESITSELSIFSYNRDYQCLSNLLSNDAIVALVATSFSLHKRIYGVSAARIILKYNVMTISLG